MANKYSLTAEQIDQLRKDKEGGEATRVNFYVDYAAAIAPFEPAAAALILDQASITTYSGPIGGAALYGNFLAKAANPDVYNITLDQFSFDIVKAIEQGVMSNVDDGFGGVLDYDRILNIDHAVWDSKHLGKFFPGNMLYLGSKSQPALKITGQGEFGNPLVGLNPESPFSSPGTINAVSAFFNGSLLGNSIDKFPASEGFVLDKTTIPGYNIVRNSAGEVVYVDNPDSPLDRAASAFGAFDYISNFGNRNDYELRSMGLALRQYMGADGQGASTRPQSLNSAKTQQTAENFAKDAAALKPADPLPDRASQESTLALDSRVGEQADQALQQTLSSSWLDDYSGATKGVALTGPTAGLGLSGLPGFNLAEKIGNATFSAAQPGSKTTEAAPALTPAPTVPTLSGAAANPALTFGMEPYPAEFSGMDALASLALGDSDYSLGAANAGAEDVAAGGTLGSLAAPQIAAGAAPAPGSGRIGRGGALASILPVGIAERYKREFQSLDRFYNGYSGESDEERQPDIVDGMKGEAWIAPSQEAPKTTNARKPIDMHGGWGLIGKWLGLQDGPGAVSAQEPNAPAKKPPPFAVPSPVASPSSPDALLWPEFPMLPDSFVPAAFPSQGDVLGPTVGRAQGLSPPEASAKPKDTSIQVQPGQVVVQLDSRTIATAVIEFMARQPGGPNTGPTDFNSSQFYSPSGMFTGAAGP